MIALPLLFRCVIQQTGTIMRIFCRDLLSITKKLLPYSVRAHVPSLNNLDLEYAADVKQSKCLLFLIASQIELTAEILHNMFTTDAHSKIKNMYTQLYFNSIFYFE